MSITANDNISEGVSDDLIQPFQLDVSNFRGRIVRLDQTINNILSAHNYPYAVSKLLAEALSLTCILGAMLKYDGIFTLQLSGKGAIKSLVCDITTEGSLRGYAAFDQEAIEALQVSEVGIPLSSLCGEGYLAFTVDQKMSDRYQGIVELQKESLVKTVLHYFSQSEQIKTAIQVEADKTDDGWVSAALMLQKLPEDGEYTDNHIEDWNRSEILLNSCKAEELLDRDLHLNDLLYRLFNQEGVIVFQPLPLRDKCRCSKERVLNVLHTLSEDDLNHAQKDGFIEMVCEFCSKAYRFERDEIRHEDTTDQGS